MHVKKVILLSSHNINSSHIFPFILIKFNLSICKLLILMHSEDCVHLRTLNSYMEGTGSATINERTPSTKKRKPLRTEIT